MLTISCKESGEENCDYVAKGNTEQELMEDGFKHAKEAHGFTDEQIEKEKQNLDFYRKLIKEV